MKKSVGLVLGMIVMSLFVTGCRDRRPDGAQQVIRAFGRGCVTKGDWSDAALSQTQSLITIFRDLSTTGPCQGFATQLSAMQSQAFSIQALMQDPAIRNFRVAEEQVQELTQTLSATSDPAMQALLANSLVQAQVDLATARAQLSFTNQSEGQSLATSRYISATRSLSSGMRQILSDAGNLNECLRQSPATAVQLGTNILGLSGSFMPAVIGGSVQLLAGLINLGVEFGRRNGEIARIYDLYKAEIPTAISCGLESMSELYCNANDAHDLLELQASGYPENSTRPEAFWMGMDLMNRRIPNLKAWLMRLKNGVVPFDPYDASRQIDAWSSLQALQNLGIRIEAIMNFSKVNYLVPTNSDGERRTILLTLLQRVAYTTAGGDGPGPLGILGNPQPSQIVCWLSRGYDGAMHSPCPPFSMTNSLAQWISDNNLIPSHIDVLIANWRETFGVATEMQNRNFSQTVTVDIHSILSLAWDPTVDNISVRQTFQRILDFIALIPATEYNPQLVQLLTETRDTITQVLAILDKVPTTREEAIQQIQQLFTLLDLRRSVSFFNERIAYIVRSDLQHRVNTGEVPNNVHEILMAAGADIQERLSATGNSSLYPLSQDISTARQLTEQNIRTFRNYYAPILHKVVKRLHDLAHEDGEPASGADDRSNSQTLAHLCFMVLATGNEWPDRESLEICRGTTLYSPYQSEDQSLNVNFRNLEQQLKGKPLSFRMCSFHRYLRANRLAAILRGRPRPIPVKMIPELYFFD